MIDNPNKGVTKSILDYILKDTPKNTGVKYTTKHITPKGMPPQIWTDVAKKIPKLGKIPPAAKKMPPGLPVANILTALLGGYGIGTLLNEEFGLSDKISEYLIQDPDMSGAGDMWPYRGLYAEKFQLPTHEEDYYEGETEATIEDLQKVLQPMMQTPEKVRWK